MKFNRIVGLCILALCLLSIANATTNDAILYYSLDNSDLSGSNPLDVSGNGNDGTNTGNATTGQTGILKQSFYFDGTNYVSTTINPNGSFTASIWFKTSGTGIYQTQYSDENGNIDGWKLIFLNTDFLTFSTSNGGSRISNNIGTISQYNDNAWHQAIITYDGSRWQVFIDNVTKLNNTQAMVTPTSNFSVSGGDGNEFLGNLDEVAVYNRVLTSDERNELYNGGVGFNPYSDLTPIITTNLSNYYNTVNISIQLNTTSNTNMSYYLDGGGEVSICTNCNNSILNLTSLSEQLHNISFKSLDANGIEWTNESFINDYTAPVIDVIGNLTPNSFFVNFSDIVNVTDALSGLASCIINITDLENVTSPDNQIINCTDSFTFQSAGLHNLNLLAIDNAGNSNTAQANLTANPFCIVQFNDTALPGLVTNYTLTVYQPSGLVQTLFPNSTGQINLPHVVNGTLELGIKNLTFEQIGYATENFTFNVSEGVGDNVTYNVTNSKIIVTIFDRTTGDILTGLTEVFLVGTIGFEGNTTTGFLNITDINFLPETYQLIATHSGYESGDTFFTYNNQELLSVNVYLLASNDTNIGTAIVQVKDDSGLFITSASCNLLEWKPSLSSYISVSDGLTDVNGKYTFDVELGVKIYKSTCTYNGVSSTILLGNGGVVTQTGQVNPIFISTVPDVLTSVLGDITYSLVNVTINSTHQRVTFSWTDTNNIVTQACLKIYKSEGFGKVLLSPEQCVQSSVGEIQQILNVNQTFDTIVQAVFVKSNDDTVNGDTLTFFSTESFESLVKEYHLDLVIPLLFFFLGVAWGLNIDPQNIYISIITVFLLEWLSFVLMPTAISFTTVLSISVILLGILWGLYKGR